MYGSRFAIKHSIQGDHTNEVRIWKTNSLFDLWYDDFSSRNFVAALDYEVKEDHIKIEYMSINDEENNRGTGVEATVDSIQSIQINRALLDFVKNIAKEEHKPKVVVDVHHNLRIFNRYYKKDGFQVTPRQCSDNPYWIETECNIELS
jgi:hypothetical protein